MLPIRTPLLIAGLAVLLSACGGGSAGTAAPSMPAPDATPKVDLQPAMGDFYSYKEVYVNTSPGNTAPPAPLLWYVDIPTSVNGDGTWSETSTNDDAYIRRATSILRADGSTSSFINGACTTTYASPTGTSLKDLAVGVSWTTALAPAPTYSAGCTPSTYPTAGTRHGEVVAEETLTVAAGTFKTLKVVSSASTSYASGNKTATESTIWRDSVTRRVVKENYSSTSTTAQGKVSSYTAAIELQGYADAKRGRQSLNVERFAGPWSGSYSGSYSGSCSGQISTDGVLDAACGGGQFSIHGSVDARGQVTFSLSSGGVSGPVFSGSFESPLTINGTWSAGAGVSGNWTLNHL
ncbi:hypothetical protein [Duganella hordei]|uniref:hypothetical protein n=1 Tax=Duganella hordei TaxID=2865934 RepID=UPI0030EA6149